VHAAVGADLDDEQRLVEHRRARRDGSFRVEHERTAVEHDFVLSAAQVRIEQRDADLAHARSHRLLAVGHLAEVERRCIDHAQQLRAGSTRSARRLVEPGVLADDDADLQPLDLEHQRRQPRVAPRREIAPLVEHLVIGQLALAVGAEHAPAGEHRSRVVARVHDDGARPKIALLTELMWMTDDDMQPFAVLQVGRDAGQGLRAALHERRAQQQILGRVAAQRQLGRDDELRALRVRAPRRIDDAHGVAREIADRRVDLSERDFQRSLG
jgi:hypothetical protein